MCVRMRLRERGGEEKEIEDWLRERERGKEIVCEIRKEEICLLEGKRKRSLYVRKEVSDEESIGVRKRKRNSD